MTTHVFVGAGPANLDRALKLARKNPDDRIILIDSRQAFDRGRGRSNVFFFDEGTANSIKTLLMQSGVDEESIQQRMSMRPFALDKKTKKNSYMIQIRDLQKLFLLALESEFSRKRDKFIPIEAQISNDPSRTYESVLDCLNFAGINLEDNESLEIHLATGALKKDAKDAIYYPSQSEIGGFDASPDVGAMITVPKHVTATFQLSSTGSITPESLAGDHLALADTDWKTTLGKFHWNLLRAPSVRIFYASDVLYIGAEMPAKITSIQDETERKTQTMLYLQAILALTFPHLATDSLIANPGAGMAFDVPRAEHGQFQEQAGEKSRIHRHGDARYLPHYQTASGFVLAMNHNDLYVEINQLKTFHDVFVWGRERKLITEEKEDKIYNKYRKQMPHGQPDAMISAFKTELLNAATRDVLSGNQEKVGQYFKGLQEQELYAFQKDIGLKILVSRYNKINHSNIIGVELLKTDNVALLKYCLPKLINIDIDKTSHKELFRLRDAYLRASQLFMTKKQPVHCIFHKKTNLKKEDIFLTQFIQLAAQDPTTLLNSMKHISSSLEANKTLHHRAAISIFKGANSDLIHRFAKEIERLEKQKPADLAQQLLTTYADFHDKLIANRSVRTLTALTENTESVIKRPQSVNSSPK